MEFLFQKILSESTKSDKRPIISDLEAIIAQILYEKNVLAGVRTRTSEFLDEQLEAIRHKFELNIIGGMLSMAYKLLNKPIDFKYSIGLK